MSGSKCATRVIVSTGWVVPKKYLEKVGDDGFKKAPVGAREGDCCADLAVGRLAGVGPRVSDATIGTMGGYPWLSPYEDVTLKAA